MSHFGGSCHSHTRRSARTRKITKSKIGFFPGRSLFHRTNVRRHELPATLLFCPHLRRLKLTAVHLIVCFAAPGREHSHHSSVPIEVNLDLVVSILRFILGGRSGRFLSGESLGLVRYFAVRERKDEIVTPQAVKDGGILSDQRRRQLALEFNQLTFNASFGWRRFAFGLGKSGSGRHDG